MDKYTLAYRYADDKSVRSYSVSGLTEPEVYKWQTRRNIIVENVFLEARVDVVNMTRTVVIEDDATITITLSSKGKSHEIECEGWLYNTITFSREE